MEPSWRKPVGVIALLIYLALYAGGVSLLGPAIARLPNGVNAVAYLILGVAWLLPLKPLLQWMTTGEWHRR